MQENMLNDQRRMWKYIVFGILTLGIYDIIFMWYLVTDLNRACGYVEQDEEDRSPNYLLVVLLSILTLGIYGCVWYYRQGNRMRRAGKAYGIEIDEKGGTYLLWILLGVWLFGVGPFIAIYLFISNLNRLCRAYNRRISETPEEAAFGNSGGPSGYTEPAGSSAPYGAVGSSGSFGGQGQTPSSGSRGETLRPGSGGYGVHVMLGDDTPTRGAVVGRICCVGGSYKGAELELQPGRELVIGRNSEMAQLVLSDQDISRKHCSIRYTAEGWYFVTDYSTYGVYINDTQKMEKNVSVRCSGGTKLTLGNGNNVFILK